MWHPLQGVLHHITELFHTCQLSSSFHLPFPHLLSGPYPTNGCCLPLCDCSHRSSCARWWGTVKSALINKDKQGLCCHVKMCNTKSDPRKQPIFFAKSRMWTAKNCGALKLYCLSFSLWGSLALTCFFQYKHNSVCVWLKCTTKRIASLPIVPCWEGTNWTIQWHMLVTLLHTLLECFQILWCLQLGSL